MEQVETRQMSESFRLGAILALAGGFLDAYTYLVCGAGCSPTPRPATSSCWACG